MLRPLLLAHSIVCEGPWTPTGDLDGWIEAKGLVPGEDVIVIRIRDVEEATPDYVITLESDTEVNIGPIEKALIQASHTQSSGREIFVWVS